MDPQQNQNSVSTSDNMLRTDSSVLDNGLVSQYATASQVYSTESLDVAEERPLQTTSASFAPTKPKFVFTKRKALIVSVGVTLLVTALTAASMSLLLNKNHGKENALSANKQQDIALKDAEKSSVPAEFQSANESVLVNGDLITKSTIKISSGGFVTVLQVANPTGNQTITLPNGSGTFCLDSNNCNFAASNDLNALQNIVNTLQAQVSAIGPVPTAGVDSLNNQKGAVTIQGSTNQITVNSSGGVITISTPQNLDANANVQFNSLIVSPTGQITSNKLAQTASGNNVSIDAGSDSIIFTANGRTYQLPNSGGASQTICTTVTCGGGGSSVLLAPGSAQTENTADDSIFINDTAGGALIRLQTGGVDQFTVANNGDTTIDGNLTVSGLGSGVVKSTAGLLSVSAVNLATEVSGQLSVANGGTGAGTFTTNGVIYGNGSGALQATSAGTSGQVLVADGSGIPNFVTFSGDATITQTGVITIATGAVTSAKIADGTITGADIGNSTIANSNLQNSSLTLTAGNGLANGGSVSLGGTTTLDIGQGDGITVNANDIAVDNTVCRTSGNCAGVGGVGDVLQGGNSFGTTMTVGTNDAQALGLETNGVTRLTISSAGDALFSGNLDTNGSLTVGNSNQFVISNTGVITSGTWNGSTIGIGYGGTGLATTPANGQLLIGNGSGYSLATLTNSDGTVDILNGAGSIDISVPRADQCSTCADYTLSNLADIIAINKSLLPASAGAINLGGPSVPYSKLYLSGTSASPASNNFTISGTATAGRTINLPDADGTFCLLETCIRLQAGSPGTQQTGHINISGNVLATNLVLGGSATVNTLAPAASTALTLGATGSGQTTNLQGNSISFTNGSATYTFNSTSGSHTLCDDTGNCAGTGGGVIASGGSAYNLPVFTSANTIANSIFSQNAGATVGTVTGTLQVTGATLSGTGALTVSSTGGANALNLSSGSGTLGLTGSTATIQRVGNSLTLDINSGANSTLTVTNSNGGFVANLSVEGGINIGSGQTYKINNADINTGGTLNNVAYLDQANAFSNVGNTTFAGTINGQTISSTANFTGSVVIQGSTALTLGTSSSVDGAVVFRNDSGANTVTLQASASNPASSFSLKLPSALGTTGDCLEQIDASGTLGFVGCASGLGGSGTTGTIALFTGTSAIGDSLLTQSGSLVSLTGASNGLQIDGTLTVGLNGASGNVGKVVLNDGSNPGRAVTVSSQQAGSSYTLLLPTTADVGSACLVLTNVSAGVNKITGGSCAAGGSGGNITATGTTNGRLARFTSDGPSYTAAASLIEDDSTGIGINIAPQSSYILTVGSAGKFKVTDTGQLEIGITGSNPLTLANNGNISNVGTLTATGLLQTSAGSQALTLSGAPTNSATQSLAQFGGAIVGGNNATNGGTYLGLNAPSSGAGSAADFINFQQNGTSRLRVTGTGNITAGTYNGVTISGTGTLATGTSTLTLTGNSTINQSLATTSSPTFSSLALTNALSAANGGTGSDTSGAQAGATLIFNATTGKFEANRIASSDNSILVGNTDGNIDLTVNSCTTCAKTDLSNLAATTNINSTLRAQTGVDIGAASSPFRDAYIYGSSSTPASNNFRLTGTATAARTITLPDASGTACLTNTCVTLQGSGHTPQSGYIDISNDLTVGGNFGLTGTATINTLAPAASTALVLGATGSGQTSRLQGTSVSFISSGITYNFSGAGSGTHTICDDTGNCAGAGGGVTASGGSAFYLPVFNSANTVINSIISQDAGAGATIATVTGKLAVSAVNTSGTSLAVNNSSFTANNSNLANFSFTNANSTASTTTVNGVAVSPTGSTNGNSNANILNAIRLNNVTPVTNNAFYGINVGTGYDDILRYNGSTSIINGTGAVQNLNGQAASYYLNASNINAGTLSVDRGGTGVGTFTSNGVLYGNGTGAVQVTAAGSNGQCLVVASGTPAWGSCSSATLQDAYNNSSSPATILLADGKNIQFTAQDTTTDPSIVMKLSCTACGTGTTGNFLVQNNSNAALFSVAGSGAIQIGTANNGISLSGSGGTTTGSFTLSGTARNTKSIILNAEYPGTVLDAGGCSSNNNGTMTSGFTSSGVSSKPENYFQWTSSQGTAQCYEVVVQIPLPSDFDGFTGTQSIDAYSTNTTNGTIIMDKNVNGSTDGSSYGTTLTPSTGSTWENKTFSFSGSYTSANANQILTLRFRTSSLSSANVQIGKITLQYFSKF